MQISVRTLEIARLYEAELGRLRAIVRRMVGNSATAEDVVQQAFANILAKVDQAAPGSAYVAQAVRNLALNHIRDGRRRAGVEIASGFLEEIADISPSPEMVALYRSELRRLLEAVASLPPRRREAFMLNRIEGLSYDEVAARMGISRNTVITQIVAALAELDRLI